ncbi:MAG: CDP-alcohol phosphatidyltransferase family protein [Syntrophaceae bacterium]|nr:CDP-alcohol phosphatidyltransferase family protein [Syntrophaceae bacterium]
MLNLPNFFSIARVVLLLPLIYFLHQKNYGSAFAILVLAGITDAIDGAAARLLRQRTVFGAYLDPAADKTFMTCSYIALSSFGLLPWGLTLLVIGRDVVIVLGFAILRLLSRPVEASPSVASKVTTILQVATLGAPLFSLSLVHSPWLTDGLVWAASAGTVISGFQYIFKGVQILRRGTAD